MDIKLQSLANSSKTKMSKKSLFFFSNWVSTGTQLVKTVVTVTVLTSAKADSYFVINIVISTDES